MADGMQRDSREPGFLRDAPRRLGDHVRPDVVSVRMAEYKVEIGAVVEAEHPAGFRLPVLKVPEKLN